MGQLKDFLIEQMMVIGDKQKFVTALIVPAEVSLKNWCEHKKLVWTSLDEMIRDGETGFLVDSEDIILGCDLRK